MINRVLAIVTLLALAVVAAPSQAATAISYSEADNTYGWCAGYTTSDAPGCAAQWCASSGGADCRLALVCDAGWNAVAFADSAFATGFGASCDMGSAHDARVVALARCVARSRALCWTNATFSGDGTERSESENRTFDLTWYTQILLKGLGFDPGTIDGAMGSRTRSAIRAFQTDLGITETGELTEDLLYMLLTRSGGQSVIAGDMDALVESLTTGESARSFAAAYRPVSDPSVSTELGKRTTVVQRVMLAQLLRMNDFDCAIPAETVTTADAAEGEWDVTCSNDRVYFVTFDVENDDAVDILDVTFLLSAVPDSEPDIPETGPGSGPAPKTPPAKTKL